MDKLIKSLIARRPQDINKRVVKLIKSGLNEIYTIGLEDPYMFPTMKEVLEASHLCFKQKSLAPLLKIAIDIDSIGLHTFTTALGGKILYFLIQNNAVVYIGATGNRFRPNSHAKTKEYDKILILPFYKGDVFMEEKWLISRFKTKYNRCNTSKMARILISH